MDALALSPKCRPAQTADPVKERLDKSPRHHEWVDVESQDGRKVKCFVVFPEVEGKATAVIVIHENKGLTDWVRSVADRLAEAGYVAVAPDFLSGTGPSGGGHRCVRIASTRRRKGIYGLQPEQVMADLDAVAAYVKKLDASNGKIATRRLLLGRRQVVRLRVRTIPKLERGDGLLRHGA